MTPLELDAPFEVVGGVLLEVVVFAEGGDEALVEAFLVEVEGGFEGGGEAG